MDYSLSPDTVVDAGTGHRLHQDTAAVPSEVTAKDLNSIIWSLMFILNSAGIDGVQFDPTLPGSYNRLMTALQKLFISGKINVWNPDFAGNDRLYFETVEGAASTTYVRGYNPQGGPIFSVWSSDGGNKLLVYPDGTIRAAHDALDQMDLPTLRQVQQLIATYGGSPIGSLGYWPGPTPPTGWIKRNGALLTRSSYPLLTTLVQSGQVTVVSEAAWPSNPGAFTLGDGATTIRIPDGRGLVDKGYHDGSGAFTTDTTRALGSLEMDGNQAHAHVVGSQGGTNGGPNIAQTDRGGNSWNQPTSTVGNPEATVRNTASLPILRAY